MPGFVKTPKDEVRWSRAKKAAGKTVTEDSDSYWKLSNFIYHKMGITEEDIKLAEEFKKSLLSIPNASVPNAMKMPKAKAMPTALDKPSKFFKNEGFGDKKQSSIEKLKLFLEKQHSKRQS